MDLRHSAQISAKRLGKLMPSTSPNLDPFLHGREMDIVWPVLSGGGISLLEMHGTLPHQYG